MEQVPAGMADALRGLLIISAVTLSVIAIGLYFWWRYSWRAWFRALSMESVEADKRAARRALLRTNAQRAKAAPVADARSSIDKHKRIISGYR